MRARRDRRRRSGQKLPVLAVVRGAFGEALRHRGALLRALALPALATAVAQTLSVRLMERDELGAGALLMLLATPLGVVFAVSCHRIVLLGEDALPNRWSLYWSRREWRFAGWTLLTGLLMGLGVVAVVFVVTVIATLATGDKPSTRVISLAMILPTAYLTARLCLILPATAVDERPRLADAWELSRGNGLRLAVALGLCWLVVWTPTWLLREWLAPSNDVLLAVALGTLGAILGAVTVTVVSVSFRTLSRQERVG